MLSTQLKAQESRQLQLPEQTIKAGLVYNFLKYTTWPDNSFSDKKGRLFVCLFGGEPLAGGLSQLEGQTAQQSIISVAHIEDINEAAGCNLLFVNRNSERKLPELFSFLRGKHVLTVSDMEDFVSQGGMVEMTTQNKRITLYINKGAMDRSGLTIQSRLLKLAKLVSG
jgi:hypothetical protein